MTNKITRNLVSVYYADIYALNDNGTSEIAAYGDEKQQSLGWLHSEAVADGARMYRRSFRCWVVPHGEPWDSPNQLFNGQPQWPDDCGHDECTWYGHVDLPELGWADLRFFHDRLKGWEYCARHGTGGDYRSFPVSSVASIAAREHYPFGAAITHAFACHMDGLDDDCLVPSKGTAREAIRHLRVAIDDYYGQRCPDHEPECVVCQAWQAWDVLARLFGVTT